VKSRLRSSLFVVALVSLLIGACSKSTTQSTSPASTSGAAVNKASGDGGGGDGGGGNGGGNSETITVDQLVEQNARIGAEKGLDANSIQCVGDNIRKLAPSDVLTAQQATDVQTEAYRLCSEDERFRHEIVVGNNTTTTF